MIKVTKIARKNCVKGQQATKLVKSLNINDAIDKKTRQYSFSTSETLPLPIFSIIFHSFVNNAANAAHTCQRPHRHHNVDGNYVMTSRICTYMQIKRIFLERYKNKSINKQLSNKCSTKQYILNYSFIYN